MKEMERKLTKIDTIKRQHKKDNRLNQQKKKLL